MTHLVVSRAYALVATAAILAACGSLPPGASSSTVPSASLVATATPAPSALEPSAPAASAAGRSPAVSSAPSASAALRAGWPYLTKREIAQTLFARDGRVFLVERDEQLQQSFVVGLDQNGGDLPGWPWSAGKTGDRVAVGAFGPDDSLYVAVRGAGASPLRFTWALHRLTAGGLEMAGFPRALPADVSCGLYVSPGGTAWVVCEAENEATGTATTTVSAVRPDGSDAARTRMQLPGTRKVIGFTSADGPILASDGDATLELAAVDSDGQVMWTQTGAAGDALLDGAGRIVITRRRWTDGECGDAINTEYDVLASNGRHVSGWPIRLTGWASEPEVAPDGSMFVVTGDGRAMGYSLAGAVLPGWPVRNVDVAPACSNGSFPTAAGDGIAIVGGRSVTLLGRTGAIASGWPVRIADVIARDCPDCTPGPAAPLAPIVTPDRMYVATYAADRPKIAVVERDGLLPPDAQRTFGNVGDLVQSLELDPTGRVWAILTRESSSEGATSGVLVLLAER